VSWGLKKIKPNPNQHSGIQFFQLKGQGGGKSSGAISQRHEQRYRNKLRNDSVRQKIVTRSSALQCCLRKQGYCRPSAVSLKRPPLHGIIEWLGLGGTLKIMWSQPPCHEQGPLPPAQGAQSSIQPGLEHCLPWATCARVSPPSWGRISS